MKRGQKKSSLIILPVLLTISCFGQNEKDTSKQGFQTVLPSFIEVAANPDLKGNGIKRFLIGKNYRHEWTEPVRVPVLDLNKTGLVPTKEGGGKQTISLHFEDRTGHKWILRSIKKYPAEALPPIFKNTIAEKLVSDDISASYPFGALSMSILSDAAHVPYLREKLVYLPDVEALGKFRSKYGKSLVLMEDSEPAGIPAKKDGDKSDKDYSTEELVYKLSDKNTNRVDEMAVLRARLLDNFVMDFDRHEGQWDWMSRDSGQFTFYYPIPKDRDQVFYTNQGLLPRIMRGKKRLPEIQGFRAKVDHMHTFNRTARNFDRAFLNGLSEEDWSREVDNFLNQMTDSVIEAALHLQPAEIRNFSAKNIISTLKKKRQFFREDMMRYYHSISNTVSVTGSNENEEFSILKNEDGSVLVVVTKIDSAGNNSFELYRRLFDPATTREIRLYGLEGDDRFVVEGDKPKMKIRMIGGPGHDRFINHGHGKKLIAYDVNFEKNSIDKGIRNRINSDPQNNTYTRLGYNYKIVSLGPAIELSPVEGFLLGARLKLVTRGFRKDPYAMSHSFLATHTLNSSSFHFDYHAEFIKIYRNTDLMINGNLWLPTNRTNFFGPGNNTIIDKTKNSIDYYHGRYYIGNLSLLGRTSIKPWIKISYGAVFQYLKLQPDKNKNKFILEYLTALGEDKNYKQKYYGGGEIGLAINTKNNEIIPSRGVVLDAYAKVLKGLNKSSDDLVQTGGSLKFYAGLLSNNRLVFATNFGAGHIFGHYEFEQAQYLGFTSHLRGFKAQRFSGRTSAYNNTELRLKIADVNAFLFPASIGIYGFNDVGRVWADGEKSTTWHDGYGGGIWIAPMDRLVVTGYVSFSSEENALSWVTLGFVF